MVEYTSQRRAPIILAVPDGHLAGDPNGDHPRGGIYELFAHAGIPLRNGNGGYLQAKNDGGFAYADNFPELGHVKISRPQRSPKILEDGLVHAIITGTDCVVDAYTDGVRLPFTDENGGPNPALLSFDGNEHIIREFLSKKGYDLVMSFRVRPTLSGFAFPAEERVFIWDDVKAYPRTKPLDNLYVRNEEDIGVVGAEYPRYSEDLLRELELHPEGFRIRPTPESAETHLRWDTHGIHVNVESGSALYRVSARLVNPPDSIHYPIMIARLDTPDDIKELIYDRNGLRHRLTQGQRKMMHDNQNASRFKTNYRYVGWEGTGFALPPALDRMLI